MSTESGQRGDGSISSTPPFEANFMWTSPSPYRSRFQVPAYLPASPPQAEKTGSNITMNPSRRIIETSLEHDDLWSPGLKLRRGDWQSREDHIRRGPGPLKRRDLQQVGQTITPVIDPAVRPFVHQ